jgi:hypothetical protein
MGTCDGRAPGRGGAGVTPGCPSSLRSDRPAPPSVSLTREGEESSERGSGRQVRLNGLSSVPVRSFARGLPGGRGVRLAALSAPEGVLSGQRVRLNSLAPAVPSGPGRLCARQVRLNSRSSVPVRGVRPTGLTPARPVSPALPSARGVRLNGLTRTRTPAPAAACLRGGFRLNSPKPLAPTPPASSPACLSTRGFRLISLKPHPTPDLHSTCPGALP